MTLRTKIVQTKFPQSLPKYPFIIRNRPPCVTLVSSIELILSRNYSTRFNTPFLGNCPKQVWLEKGGRNNVYPEVSGEKELERRKERDWKEAVNLGCRYRPPRRAILLVKMLIRRGKEERAGQRQGVGGFIDFARLFAEDRRKLYS